MQAISFIVQIINSHYSNKDYIYNRKQKKTILNCYRDSCERSPRASVVFVVWSLFSPNPLRSMCFRSGKALNRQQRRCLWFAKVVEAFQKLKCCTFTSYFSQRYSHFLHNVNNPSNIKSSDVIQDYPRPSSVSAVNTSSRMLPVINDYIN